MTQRYWTGRRRSALSFAREAASIQARLIHPELAGLSAAGAAQPGSSGAKQAAEDSRPQLHLRHAGPLHPDSAPATELEAGLGTGIDKGLATDTNGHGS